MKITSLIEEGEWIRATVDNSDREFVYRIDVYDNVDDLKNEISKSIQQSDAKKNKKTEKYNKLKDDYDKKEKK